MKLLRRIRLVWLRLCWPQVKTVEDAEREHTRRLHELEICYIETGAAPSWLIGQLASLQALIQEMKHLADAA